MATMIRYSRPPHSTHSYPSDVGWELRERYFRRKQDDPLGPYNNEGTSFGGNIGSARGNRIIRRADDSGPLAGSARRLRSRSLPDTPRENIPLRSNGRDSRSLGSGSSSGLETMSWHSSSSGGSSHFPPGFRVGHRIEQQRRRIKTQKDNGNRLENRTSHRSRIVNYEDSDSEISSISSSESFGALGSDDEDDDAFRVSRTQLTKATHEVRQGNRSKDAFGRRGNSRFLWSNRNHRGTLLGMIVEERSND